MKRIEVDGEKRINIETKEDEVELANLINEGKIPNGQKVLLFGVNCRFWNSYADAFKDL